MDKFLKRLGRHSWLALFVCCFAVAACSDDEIVRTDASMVDGIGGKSESAVSSVIRTADGRQLVPTQVGVLQYRYDAEGRCVYVGHAYDSYYYTLSHNPFAISDPKEGSQYYKATLNKEGLLASEESRYSGNEGGYSGSETSRVNYSYDKNCQLVKISGSYSRSDKNWVVEGFYNATLTWADGNLTKIVWKEEYGDNEDRMNYRENESGEIDIVYEGNRLNAYRQYTSSIVDLFGGSDYASELSFVGIMGVGPKMLPTKIVDRVTSTDYKGDYDVEIDTYDISYALNPDGTIQTEYSKENNNSFNVKTINYTYSELNQALYNASRSVLKPETASPMKAPRVMFKRMREDR